MLQTAVLLTMYAVSLAAAGLFTVALLQLQSLWPQKAVRNDSVLPLEPFAASNAVVILIPFRDREKHLWLFERQLAKSEKCACVHMYV